MTNYASQALAIITGALEAMVVDAQCIMPGLAQVAECYHTELISTLPNIKIEGASHIDWTSENADKMGEDIVRRALAHYHKTGLIRKYNYGKQRRERQFLPT